MRPEIGFIEARVPKQPSNLHIPRTSRLKVGDLIGHLENSVSLEVRLVGADIPHLPATLHRPRIIRSKFVTTDAFWYLSVRTNVHSKSLVFPTAPPNMNLMCDLL